MHSRKRLNAGALREQALDAARTLLIEAGPQAVTLKAVGARIGRTHANLLHHFGSAAGLQAALAAHLAQTVCATIRQAVSDSRAGLGSPRAVVDLTFDAFDGEGAAALAGWMLLTGNENALDPIVETIHALVDDISVGTDGSGDVDPKGIHEETLHLVLLAMGDAMLGAPLARSLGLPRDVVRRRAELILKERVSDGVQPSG
ncbi:TetR/AcrR family transcriptional regulator [Erythrobacteraceae bacterium CFH 75059]|uniref:TetR/AcrR family transcriptional regulator n=1 Tax=Qipengyuania thermophila TaxID=2509361 RepID=UPI00101F161F|nr:helix-turn-helix domain-containing protein [Qipengyuania thermophila]TCD04952.1 TetR/AcrR family transcriptional regulator [Erythrobacteraceae bacterium CFH 75059]